MNILTEIHCYNRKNITSIALEQLSRYSFNTTIKIINDYSTEYDCRWLKQYASIVIQHEKKLTINKLKYRTFKSFLNSDYTHLYMCDNDAYHDPNYLDILIKLHEQSGKLPCTLYKSSFIKKCNVYKTVKNIPNGEIRQGLFGGISTFLSKDHVEKINKHLPNTEDEWDYLCQKTAWDSKIQKWASNSLYAVPSMSYVEHYGMDGQNHTTYNSDYGLDLTPFLNNTKENIMNSLI